jgi:tight adherence protein C
MILTGLFVLIGFSASAFGYLLVRALERIRSLMSEWPAWRRTHRTASSRLPYPAILLFFASHIRTVCSRWTRPDVALRDRAELQGWLFWDEAFQRALQVLIGGGAALLAWSLSLALSLDLALSVFFVFCSAIAGWFDPPSRLKARHRLTTEHCVDGLPGLLDGMVIALEAGQSLSRSLDVSLSRGFKVSDAAWISAMRQTLEDMKRGLGAEQAFARLRRLLPIPVIHRFSSTCVLGETQGQSISGVLRRQAQQCRREAQMAIEKRALEAPVKLMAPLMICIFPCTFIVLLAPLSRALLSVGGA